MAGGFKGWKEKIDVSKNDCDRVWEVLAGDKSVWQNDIKDNCATARKVFLSVYDNQGFSIVTSDEFDKVNPTHTVAAGVTDKLNKTITLREFAAHTNLTYMSSALHELVHWLEFPAQQGGLSPSAGFLGSGLQEGLVQVITEDILRAQGMPVDVDNRMSRDQSDLYVYTDRANFVRQLVDKLGYKPFAQALFKGQFCVLWDAMLAKWNLSKSEVQQLSGFFAGKQGVPEAQKRLAAWEASAGGKTYTVDPSVCKVIKDLQAKKR
jgi:hypothetical protein